MASTDWRDRRQTPRAAWSWVRGRGLGTCGVQSQPDILWAQDSLRVVLSVATTFLAVPVYSFPQWGNCCSSPCHIFPRGDPWRELPLLGVCQAAVVLERICSVELSGSEACPGLGPTATEAIGGKVQCVPVYQGMGRSQPSEAGTASYLDLSS